MRIAGKRRLALMGCGIGLAIVLCALTLIVLLRITQANRTSRHPNCYYCGSKAVRPSFQHGLVDRILAIWDCRPYRCEVCYSRYYRYHLPRIGTL